MLQMVAVFELSYQAGHHRWVLRDWDGAILAQNGGYLTRAAAVQDIERLQSATLGANVVEL